MYKYLVINITAFALLAAAWIKGWVEPVLVGDSTGLVYGIIAVFLVGLGLCGWWISRPEKANLTIIRHLAHTLVILGLIGTIIGFIVALPGVDPAAAANIDAVGPMISKLIQGMSIALYTTLVGSVLNVWLMLNYRLLEHHHG